MDDEVPLSGIGWRCRGADAGVASGDIAKSGDDDLRRSDQPGPCAHADRDTAACIGVEGGAIFEGKEFAPVVVGICEFEETVLGAASVGPGYWVASSGNVTDEVWKKYIEDQKPEVPDDNFKIV